MVGRVGTGDKVVLVALSLLYCPLATSHRENRERSEWDRYDEEKVGSGL